MKVAVIALLAAAIGVGGFIGYRATEHQKPVPEKDCFKVTTPAGSSESPFSEGFRPTYIVCK